MEFRKITLEDKQLVDKYLAKYPCYGSTYSMAYLASWETFSFDQMQISVDDDALIFRFPFDGRNTYLAGLTAKDNFAKVIDEIFEHDETAYIVHIEKSYASLIDESKYIIEHNVDYDEYLYDPVDLIELKGKKYHGKRGHIKKFERLYPDYVFRDFEDSDREGVLKLFDTWGKEKDGNVETEFEDLNLLFDKRDELGLKACIVEVDGKIIGFTLGEVSASNVAIVHIEKGDIEYEGIYPIINKLFASKYFSNVKYINRQEDLGLEGLRKAKRSYYPVAMSEKCRIKLRKD